MFVDYAGQTAEAIDGATGQVRRAQVLMAVLGTFNDTYAEARWMQSLPDWIGCHVGGFASFGGVARQIVRDNLEAGVTASSRYVPGISRAYQDMATHVGAAILPARARKPRDKAIAKRSVPKGRIFKGDPEGSKSPSRSCSAGSSPGSAIAGSSSWRS